MIELVKRNLSARRVSDSGDSTAVSFILIFPIFFGILMTIIDTSVYFANKGIVSNLSRDVVRQAAIFGGPGTATSQSALEQDYGYNGCTQKTDASLANNSQVECMLDNKFAEGAGLMNVKIDSIDCHVDTGGLSTHNLTDTLGLPVYCDVEWTYGGIPGSVLGFIQLENGESPFMDNHTKVSAQSEVGLESTDVRTRS